jgi:hypothetical protein
MLLRQEDHADAVLADGGSSTPCCAISARKYSSGIWIRMPGAVAHQLVGADRAAVVEVLEDLQTLLDDRVRLVPLMWATKPTPQASCSRAGS